MKTSDFKKILKPLIKQTIKEVLFEEGVLSGVVSEVARGLQNNLVVEAASPQVSKQKETTSAQEKEYEKNRQARIKRLNESTKTKLGADAFHNTKELSTGASHSPLGGVSAADSGVDISDIEKLSKGRWKHLI